MSDEPDRADHLRDELRRLDLLLERYLLSWRADRGGPGEGEGLYVGDAHVDRLLHADPMRGADDPRASDDESIGDGGSGADSTGTDDDARRTDATGRGEATGDDAAATGTYRINHSDATDRSIDHRVRALTEAIEEHRAASDPASPLSTLAERFDLGPRQVDALVVALAPELDLKYEPIYAYLQDDLTRKRPTVGLILRVVGGTVGSEVDERDLFTPGSPLLDDRLVRTTGAEGALLSRPVEVDRRIVAFILGEDALSQPLQRVASVLDTATAGPALTAPDAGPADSGIARLPIAEDARERLHALEDRVGADPPIIVNLQGPYGSGRRGAAAALAETAERPLLAVDAEKLPAGGTGTMDILERVVREARLREAAVLVRGTPPAHPEDDRVDVGTLLSALDDCPGPVFLAGASTIPPRLSVGLDNHEFFSVTFDRPDFERRRACWEQLDLPGDVDALASKFRFTAGQIEDAATTARTLSPGDVTPADVREACRAQSREQLGELAAKVDPSYGWDDIVLPADERRGLRAVAAHVDHRGTVYSEWGFGDAFSRGTGVNALFVGRSGTGKTMAAEVIANETGLDLYTVDLANVVSKYIGETESNLGQIFDEAEHSNAVLFFDEADALFGERSEVSDAHDRYANIEVDYLLQRMEDHDGVVLLATNLESNLDDAFRRRIDVTVEFPLPDRDAREQIWRGMFPSATPVGDLDWQFLAGFELTGGDIKSTALTAAFLAADDDDAGDEPVVEMRHVVDALWRELQSSGRLISPEEFAEYREFVP